MVVKGRRGSGPSPRGAMSSEPDEMRRILGGRPPKSGRTCRRNPVVTSTPNHSSPMRRKLLPVLALLFLAACTDEGPVSGPGTMTATVRSPNGAEGAAVVVLLGDDVGAITAAGGVEVYSYAGNSATKVVLINQAGGDLSFQVAVADTTQPPAFVLQGVAGPDDELRPSLFEYDLEFVR